LLIVIASVYLAGLARYGIVNYSFNGAFSWQTKASVVLGFLASSAFIVAVALVLYRREDLSRLSLVAGMGMLILLLAIGVSSYF